MKLNIITGLLFALLLSAGINNKALAQCCGWHSHYHYGCCEHMDSKDKDSKDKDEDKVADKDNGKEKECCHQHTSCCHHGCGWGSCHSWCYVAPKHCCHHHHYSCCHHSCHHHDDCCGYGYYYRGGGH